MMNSAVFTKKIRKIGAMMALVGFALGIAFGVLFAMLIFLGLSISEVLTTVMPIGALGLFALVVGRRLRNYRRVREEEHFLLGLPEEEEEEQLDLNKSEKYKERVSSFQERKDSLL